MLSKTVFLEKCRKLSPFSPSKRRYLFRIFRCQRKMHKEYKSGLCVDSDGLQGEGERRKKAVLHFNGFDLGGKSYIRPHPSPLYCTAMQQLPQNSHTIGYTHVRTRTCTHPCQDVNTTAFLIAVFLDLIL